MNEDARAATEGTPGVPREGTDAAVRQAVAGVRARIAAAARGVGRDPTTVRLVAVSKGFGAERLPVPASGERWDLGENRVQELLAKQRERPEASIRWHFIGSLQRNKVRDVVGRVVLIHGVDSLRLAEVIGARAQAAGLVQEILLEVNTSGEVTKHGVAPSETLAVAGRVGAVEGVALRGLMTMAAPDDPDGARASFRTLRGLRDALREAGVDAPELSMGMTGDFEIAIEEGATIVRIGTAIFGERPHEHGG